MNILDIAIAKKLAGGGGGSGTDNYNDLSNLPKINDTTLSGNKSSSALGLQSEINSDSKLASDLVDDTNQDNKFVTSTEKNTWNGKQNAIDADHKINADYVDDSTSTNKFVTASDKETWNAKQNAIDNSHKLSSDLVDDANHTNKFVTSTEKQTWNAKQNAIDADHKLSSSLVSFTTAEAAALASGIDSSKVGQISTNQTNIWYAIDTGVKNWFVVPDGTYSSKSAANSSVCSVENGVIKIITCSTADTRVMTLGTITLPAGTYKLSNYILGGSSNYGDVRLMNPDGSRLSPTGTGVFTIAAETIATVKVYTWSTSALNASVSPLLCIKSIYDQDSSYAKPSLPNYDLTRLEAEDRVALAEEIDNGAKNLVDWRNTVSFQDVTIDNGTYTTSGDSLTVLRFQVAAINSNGGQIMAFNGNGTVPTANGVINIPFTIPTGTAKIRAGHNGSTYNGRFDIPLSGTTLEVGKSYVLQVNVTQYTNSSGIFKWKDLMVCTKAAFGVSNKFVPYRPNYDLVCKRASGYFITSETATFAGLLGSAVAAAGFGTTATSHSGLCSVSTTTDDEYLLFYWYYSYNVFCECIQITAKSISLTNKNNQGTIVVTGGTAPYKVTVTVFN